MAIARNLNKGKFRPRRTANGQGPKPASSGNFLGKHKKKIVVGLIIFSILAGIYGIFSLSHLAPDSTEKQELSYQTGDQPLPEKVTIYINASGGLNMREEPNTTSKILKIIPDKTKLEAVEVDGEWYKVTYDGKTGWVNEKYVKRYTEDTALGAADGKSYQNATFDYSLVHPSDWVSVDYGEIKASGLVDYAGFGMQLADELDPSVLPPVAVKVTKDAKTAVDADYKKRTSVVASRASVAGVAATKYVFTASSGVQMTAFVVSGNGYTYILEESGGYADELVTISSSFKFN